MNWNAYLSVIFAFVAVHLWARLAMGPAVSIGDEKAYISCGGEQDPYSPGQFLRVPLLAWFSKQAHRHSSDPEKWLRSASTLVSALTILVSMVSAQHIGGENAAFAVGLLLVFMPGRIVLSYHVWPDIWLGFWLSLICLVMVYPELPINLRAGLLGTVAALAFMTRFDALLLAPVTGIGLAPASIYSWLLILLPTLLAFAFLSIRNARRYQIPWPDNTWMFNFMVSARETEREQVARVQVDHEVWKVAADWNKLSTAERMSHGIKGLRTLLMRPVRLFFGALMRVWASMGPDSFVLQRLLPPTGLAYPQISASFCRGVQIALMIAFPIFASVTILALWVTETPLPGIWWPCLGLGVSSLIHSRTRYRQAWLPGAALLLVSAVFVPGFYPALLNRESGLEWLVCTGLVIALIYFPVRPEIRKITRKGLSFGWGGVSQGMPASVLAPEAPWMLKQSLEGGGHGTYLGCGLGRSYGDCALNTAGTLIDCRSMNRILSFDTDSGILECLAGASLLEINHSTAAQGWMLPVVPGTQFVTIGGAIANDIHGKNHVCQGTFGMHVIAVKLLRSDGKFVVCHAWKNADLFAATIGGLGLTGLIVSARLQLRPVKSLKMITNRRPFSGLDMLFSLVAEQSESWEYQVAWFDPTARCRKGHYITANHSENPGDLDWPHRLRIRLGYLGKLPTDLPGRFLMKSANIYYRNFLSHGEGLASAEAVLYPMDRIPEWNKLFGRQGFFQYQCVLPEVTAASALDELLGIVESNGQPASLAVGKWFGHRSSPGLLSFPLPGFSIALDFANRGQATRRLLDSLDRVIDDFDGRLYPAKDARMPAALFRKAYPDLETFVQQIDPLFISDFWRRMDPAI